MNKYFMDGSFGGTQLFLENNYQGASKQVLRKVEIEQRGNVVITHTVERLAGSGTVWTRREMKSSVLCGGCQPGPGQSGELGSRRAAHDHDDVGIMNSGTGVHRMSTCLNKGKKNTLTQPTANCLFSISFRIAICSSVPFS